MTAKPTPKSLKAKLWKLTSEYVRRKDADYNGTTECYTCGAVKFWKEMDAGHAIGGRTNSVLFDLTLLEPQCKRCNMPPLCGNYYEFGKRKNVEYGDGWYEQKKIDARKTVKITVGDYVTMIEEMKRRLEALDQRQAA